MKVDILDARAAEALAGLLDRSVPLPGEPLPLMWQIVLHLARPAQAELAADGHPITGFPRPPAPEMRRRYAGGCIEVVDGGPTVGAELVADSAVVDERLVQGKSGPLHFVTTRTTLREQGAVVLIDERDIVYLRPSDPTPAPSSRPRPAGGVTPEVRQALAETDMARTVEVDPRLLFRFSALTYNAHRIHYDAVWNREREGLDGLVVHGPLQALLMAEVGAKVLPRRVTTYRYRLQAPLLHHEGMHVLAQVDAAGEVDVRVVDDAGRATATAHLG